ncbi:Piso0_002017 [Millerozyma farinosa CBS 7064]|uniref:Piso0_002017 protein n=1 Tax=Pichia sorbitophila (strain ATCC MYA-4447 / BCRC 22081 / CBS 7064 / NBRC 10061 / NRRL Y-12695) TaxID=559304 RepID=G8YBG6_PICSO|nr:Piso0_002017 [Millerozyma farinosa CBS 7064]
MSLHGTINEEVSQPISESYFYLSNDESDVLSDKSSSVESDGNFTQNTTMLMRLARALDSQGGSRLKTEQEHGRKAPQNAGKDERKSASIPPSRLDALSPFSSHSTPLRDHVHRRATGSLAGGPERNSNKTNKAEKETRLSVGQLQKIISALHVDELQDLKNVMDNLVLEQQVGNGKPAVNREMYVTPKRNQTNSVSLDSSSSGEDDDLSLTGVQATSTVRPKKQDDLSNEIINESLDKMEKDRSQTSEVDSPITTPPHSQDYLDKVQSMSNGHSMGRRTLVPGLSNNFDHIDANASYIPKRVAHNRNRKQKEQHDMIAKQKAEAVESDSTRHWKLEYEQLKKENLNLKIKLNELEIKLNECDNNQIPDISFTTHGNDDNENINVNSNGKGNANVDDGAIIELEKKIEALRLDNDQTSINLSNARAHISELNNEINYLRNNNDGNKDNLASQKNKNADLVNEINALKRQLGVPSCSISRDSVSEEFKKYYDKLQLSRVDSLTKVELSNLVKNIMLSLLISDFEHLPSVSVKIGKFFKLITSFMDQLHSIVYDDSSTSVKPSHYLKSYEFGTDELASCLNGMLEILSRYEDEQVV